MDWITIDKYNSNSYRVLVCESQLDEGIISIGRIVEDRWLNDEGFDIFPTHYMELPKPPIC